MTVRIPPENIFDKILNIFGKKRKIIIPEGTKEIYEEKGHYVIIKVEREGFLKHYSGTNCLK